MIYILEHIYILALIIYYINRHIHTHKDQHIQHTHTRKYYVNILIIQDISQCCFNKHAYHCVNIYERTTRNITEDLKKKRKNRMFFCSARAKMSQVSLPLLWICQHASKFQFCHLLSSIFQVNIEANVCGEHSYTHKTHKCTNTHPQGNKKMSSTSTLMCFFTFFNFCCFVFSKFPVGNIL